MTEANWVKKWGYEMRATAAPGICELREGGYLVHGKLTEDGTRKRVMRTVRGEGVTLRDAQRARLEMLDDKREQAQSSTSESKPLFAEYAAQLFEQKVAERRIKSPKTMERWENTLRLHLVPAFGSCAVDAIRKRDIEDWKTKVVAPVIDAGKFSPRTANGWLSILREILRCAVDDHELERDATHRVHDFSTAEHPTYTDEAPNSLSPEQAAAFLPTMKRKFPQHYAMTYLGFVTGLRPSTLRPLRRQGPEADVLWDEGALKIRRSNALGQHVMNTTKTELRYRLGLPREVIDVLWDHALELTGKRAESELLFPSKRGGFMSRSALDKPFAAVSKAIGLPFTLTPRGMRRTYQDLARKAGVEKQVRKAVCGHETDEMSELYSTIQPEEMAEAVGKIARSLDARRAA